MSKQEWIYSRDRLPETIGDGMYVIRYLGDYEFAFYEGDCWDSPNDGFIDLGDVDKWYPLPDDKNDK